MKFLFVMLLIDLLLAFLDKDEDKVQSDESKEKIKHPAEFDLR